MKAITSSNLALEAVSARFVGTHRLVVGGNAPHATVQLLDTVAVDASGNELQFVTVSEYVVPKNYVECFELCQYFGQGYLAVSCTDKSGRGQIKLLSIPVQYGGNDAGNNLVEHISLANPVGSDDSSYKSIATCPPNVLSSDSILAATNELGEVVLWDVGVSKIISKFQADGVGVNKVVFSSSGELLTAGCSSNSQLRLWDIRASLSSNAAQPSAVKQFKHPQAGPASAFQYYSAVCSYPNLSKVLCGTADGVVCEWDCRTLSKTPIPTLSMSCHRGAVTSICSHPNKNDYVLTSSVDGTVREFPCSGGSSEAFGAGMDVAGGQQYLSADNILLAEPAAINSIDSLEPGLFLAASSIGGLWRIQID
jgi:WD40 repeat protein